MVNVEQISMEQIATLQVHLAVAVQNTVGVDPLQIIASWQMVVSLAARMGFSLQEQSP
jgi:hypothetical protein